MLTEIREIVKEAGQILRSAHAGSKNISEKSGYANFVTAFDCQIQEFLVERLKAVFPEAGFIGEENHMQEPLGEGYYFIIDPIDGTTNFIHDYHHSCISVGVAYQGKGFAGVVYNPYLDEMYWAKKGEGAYCNDGRLTVKDVSLEESIVAFGCARYNSEETDRSFDFAKKLYLQSHGIRNGGSSTLDICRIASGRNGLYFEMLLQPWDYAAASVILEEAGGVITTMDGTPITLDAPCSILAGSPVVWEESMGLWNK
ncbi:inositol monophosphatase family protein [Robinsoniella peoriensis]|uniref:inositol monophosphatase family protein n=1 Tax=Robinsoniella peoriensis TaxID=180332 RepID=UPI003751EAE0